MTAQIHDTILFENTIYSICGISGDSLFTPTDQGIEPVSTSTACWRGYQASYEISNHQLHLSRLSIGLSPIDALRAKSKSGIEIHGKRLQRTNSDPILSGAFHVEDLAEKIPFTGGILLGDRFIQQLYIHMGFHPHWKYEKILELQFIDGELVEVDDLSVKISEIRNQLIAKGLKPGETATDAETLEWIEDCFSLDYTSE